MLQVMKLHGRIETPLIMRLHGKIETPLMIPSRRERTGLQKKRKEFLGRKSIPPERENSLVTT